jgi:hypothetical protein
MEQQKSYYDWEVGKLTGMIEGLALQGVITESVCKKMTDLLHSIDNFKDQLFSIIKKGAKNE